MRTDAKPCAAAGLNVLHITWWWLLCVCSCMYVLYHVLLCGQNEITFPLKGCERHLMEYIMSVTVIF
jgi:hypothetical protein